MTQLDTDQEIDHIIGTIQYSDGTILHQSTLVAQLGMVMEQ